jgi:hypothetical protein
MFNMVSGRRSVYVILVGLLVHTAGCGGGTTGTSSTGELKLAGYAQGSSGQRLGDRSMTVRSGVDQGELLASQTDAEGSFTMALPGSESSVLIEIDGKVSSPIARRFNGSSILSTVLTLSSSGGFISQGSFEVQVDQASLCQSLGIEGNELYVKGAISGPCEVRARIAPTSYSLSSFSASLEGICDGSSTLISTVPADTTGVVSIDVGGAIEGGCSSPRIVVSSTSDPSRRVVIPIY